MRYKRIYVMVLIVLMSIGAYANDTHHTKQTNEKTKIQHQSLLYNIMKYEIEAGYSLEEENCTDDCNIVPITIDEDYMHVEIAYLKKYLKKQGFKFLSTEAYNAKIKEYFGVNPANGSRMLYSGCEEAKGLNDIIAIDAFDRPVGGIYISKDGLATLVHRLPYLINYQTNYPGLYRLEKTLPRVLYDEKHAKVGTKEFWYEEYEDIHGYRKKQNIDQIIQANLETTLRLNKYLLDQDITQLDWLFHHTNIPQELMGTYGYRGDKNLIEYLLNKNYMKDIIWYKGCKKRVALGANYNYDGALRIQTKTFKIIVEKLKGKKFKNPKENIYLDSLCTEAGNLSDNVKLNKKDQDTVKKYIIEFVSRYVKDKSTLSNCGK